MVAYVRVLPPGTAYPQVSIGRVVVEKSSRGKELGIELMVRAEEWAWDLFQDERDVVIMAQSYLLKLVRTLGLCSSRRRVFRRRYSTPNNGQAH